MAVRGQRPKADALRVIEGGKARAAGPVSAGAFKPPAPLTGRPGALWRGYIVPAYWLGPADAPKAWLWCKLQAEAEVSVADMTAARLGQLRNLGSELGFDPTSRARLAGGGPPAVDDVAERYFQ